MKVYELLEKKEIAILRKEIDSFANEMLQSYVDNLSDQFANLDEKEIFDPIWGPVAFNAGEVENVCSMCKNAQMGCVACKKLLNEKLNALLDPMRERRAKYEANPSLVKEIVAEGTKKANEIGNENIRIIKEKMHVTM